MSKKGVGGNLPKLIKNHWTNQWIYFYFQLREEFDRGGQITLSMETGVHDVATLLKEFFRDLPEPVIPKEVQSALLASQSKLKIGINFQQYWNT